MIEKDYLGNNYQNNWIMPKSKEFSLELRDKIVWDSTAGPRIGQDPSRDMCEASLRLP